MPTALRGHGTRNPFHATFTFPCVWSYLGGGADSLLSSDLDFARHRVLRFASRDDFGPYADQLRHLLNGLDGSYLHCEKRLSDAGPLDLIRFDDSRRSAVESFLRTELCRPYHDALNETAAIIDGFESPLGMELLATVDWINTEMKRDTTLPGVKQGLPIGSATQRRRGIAPSGIFWCGRTAGTTNPPLCRYWYYCDGIIQLPQTGPA